MDTESRAKPLHENLDTAFVNLWSLLRNLTQKGFIGRVRVDLKDYSADIFLNGSQTPMVRELDHLTGAEKFEEAALHQLVLRARETPGTITVFEGLQEATFAKSDSNGDLAAAQPEPRVEIQIDAKDEPLTVIPETDATEPPPDYTPIPPPAELTEALYKTGSYQDWPAILETTGELMAAIERAVNASGESFETLLSAVRLQLGDDYSFLDPTAHSFQYASGKATLEPKPSVNIFVTGLSEALRRLVDRAASGERARRVRERVALEMLSVARKRADVLERSGFRAQLDRIAGTRVV